VKRIEILDYGRLGAAVCVLCFHYLFNGIVNGKLTGLPLQEQLTGVVKYGYLGVEFFFIISGYVIFTSIRGRSPGQFATSRATRLLPAFWTALLLTSLVSWLWGEGFLVVSATRLLANFTMFPKLFGQSYVDGVYWTLAYEITFYAAICGLLFFISAERVQIALLCWPVIMLFAQIAGLDRLPFLGGYYAFFAAGAAFASRGAPFIWRASAIAMSLYLCIEFSIENATALGSSRQTTYDPMLIGALISAMFLFFGMLDVPRVRGMELPGSRLAGGVTYPLYLIHGHIGYMSLSAFGDPDHPILSTLTMAVVALVGAAVIHFLIEKRFATAWKQLFSETVGRGVDGIHVWLHRLLRRILARGGQPHVS